MSDVRQRGRKNPLEPIPSSSSRSSSSPANAVRDVSLDRVDKGRWRSGLEIPRKLLHSSISILVTYLWLSHPRISTLLKVFGTLTVVIGTADLLRFNSTKFEETYEKALGFFMRESERHTVNGTIYYLVGVLFCLTFYPRDIAVLSIIMLSICDTSASIFGRLFGKYTPRLPFSGTLFGRSKSLAGTLAAVLTGTVASYVFWTRYSTLGDEHDLSWVPAKTLSTWTGAVNLAPLRDYGIERLPNPNSTLTIASLSLLNGCMAGLAEAIDFFGLDDNLSLPVLFGLFCWISMWVLG
ncbi:diacylglycerol kinase [Sporobolomyces koalae]|uniref:diacylglycerol kinase n=1 Tax=Sporobolomyces koalae TaxID=500713 RepID=UPI00317299CB